MNLFVNALNIIVKNTKESKAIITVLLLISCYLGYEINIKNKDNKALREKNTVIQNAYNFDTKDCAERIIKIDSIFNARHDAYRNKVDSENMKRIRDAELKYESLAIKLEYSNNRVKQTERIIQNINSKLQ